MTQLPAESRRLSTQSSELQIRLLGPPAVAWGNASLIIPRRSVRALLYRLGSALAPVARGQLHLLFWPDVAESVARRNLSHLLTHLRRALPAPQLLTTADDGVWLDPVQVWCDARVLMDADLSAPRNGESLGYLTGLYRGPFLEGFDLPGCAEYEQWCIAERATLERRYLQLVGLLVDYCVAQGELRQAAEYAERFLETQPLSEAMHRRLITLYASQGERHRAIRQYEHCASILATELGVSPLPETVDVYRAVLDDSHVLLPRAHVPSTRSPPMSTVPFVGRSDEVRLLDEALLNLLPQQGRVVFISGEAGIGKSRLMRAFVKRHEGQIRAFYGAGREGGQVIPFQPLVDILRSMLGLGEGIAGHSYEGCEEVLAILQHVEPLWLSELSRLLPEILAALPGVPPPLPLEPESARGRLFDALWHVTSSYAGRWGRLLLCLDDLQWIDAATKGWLAYIERYLEHSQGSILVLGAFRSEDADEVLALRHALARAGALAELKLSGLQPSACFQLLGHFLGQQAPDEGLAQRLYRATAGNPFFLTETIRALVESGEQGSSSGLDQIAVASSVLEAIGSRLERLSPIARQVLEAAAVLGSSFSIDLLRLTVGRAHFELMVALEELRSRILLVEESPGYRFAHEITRQTVEASLGPLRLGLLHRRAARAYLYLQPDDYPSMALHFGLAGDLKRSMQYHGRAAARAKELFAWQVAEYHQGRMLALLEQIDPSTHEADLVRTKCEILADRANSLYLLGRQTDRDAVVAAMDTLAETANDDHVRLEAVLNRLRYLNLEGAYPQAITVAEGGLALLDTAIAFAIDTPRVQRVRSRLLAHIGQSRYYLGEPLEALGVLELAWKAAEASADPEMCGRVMNLLGYTYTHLGEYGRALKCHLQAYQFHQEGDSHLLRARALIDIGVSLMKTGCPCEARQSLDEGLELARCVGSQQVISYGLAHLGSLSLYRGEYAGAVGYLQQVVEMQHFASSQPVAARAESGLGLALCHLGDHVQSRHWLERALLHAGKTGHRKRVAKTLLQLGWLAQEQGQLDVARPKIEEGVAVATACHAKQCQLDGAAILARQARLAGDPDHCLQLAIEALQLSRQLDPATCHMLAEVEAGLALLALGQLSSAGEHTIAATTAEASQEWIGAEQAHLAHARVLSCAGQDVAARNHLERASEILRLKAEQIPDLAQRRRFLESHPM